MKNIIFHNDQWLENNAIFNVDDRALRGDGVFDTMLIIKEENTKPYFAHADLHFDRLKNNAHHIEISLKKNHDELLNIAQQLCDKNNLKAGRYALKTTLTRGMSNHGLMPPSNEETQETLTMHLTATSEAFPDINAIIARRYKRNEYSPLSQIKSMNYGDNILSLIEARHKGANEALIQNIHGHIVCASAGNIFVVIDNQLYTPPLSDGVLDGITRKLLIRKYHVIESSLTFDDVTNKAQGIFITNSIKGCRPVRVLNGKALNEPEIKIDPDFHLD